MLTNRSPSKVLPALSEGNMNWGFDNNTTPYSPGEGEDIVSLSVRPVRPEIWQAGDVTAVPQQAPILAAYFLNPPLFDNHVFRSMSRKVEAHIREYNRVNNSNFFNDYPELRLALEPSDVLDNRIQAGAITAYYRDYLTRVTMYMGAIATHRIMSKLGGHSRFSRYGSAFRWSAFHTANRVMSDFMVPSGVRNYITKATRFLTGMNVTGSPVIAFPIWRSDIRGDMAVVNSHVYNGGADKETAEALMQDADYALANYLKSLATTGAMGVVPATFRAASGIHADSAHLAGASHDANGKLTGQVIATVDYWKTELLTTNYAMSVPSSAFYEFFKAMGWIDTPIDIEGFDRAIRDNTVGDISTFAQHMAFGSRTQGTFGLRSRVNIPVGRTGTSYEKAGLHLTDEEWATALATWAATGTATDDPLYVKETMYGMFLASTAHKNSDESTTNGYYNAAQSADVINSGLLVSVQALLAKLENQKDFLGMPTTAVESFLKPSLDPQVFVNEAEYRKGLGLLRQVHLPLINVWDPHMCGFYVIASNDELVNNEWSRPFFLTDNQFTRSGGYLTMGNEKDVLIFAGDGILTHPMVSMASPLCGSYKLPVIGAGAGVLPVEVNIGWEIGLPLVKPYTVSLPGGISPNLWKPPAGETMAIRSWGIHGDATLGAFTTTSGDNSALLHLWTWFLKSEDKPDQTRHLHVLYTVQANNVLEQYIRDQPRNLELQFSNPYEGGANVLNSDTLKGLIVVPSVFMSGGRGSKGSSEGRSRSKPKFSRSSAPKKFTKSEELPIANPSASVVTDPPATEVLGPSEDEPKFSSKKKVK